ncbi:DUF4912 domain-containing protein [Calothrix sp. PCC 7507]|uniref:DUF4912 domain-containing protein n=1 Tax=Calothrix sp. PCC 7507 TaxID=99598 RepID=UPI00029F1743|nr:DUF4912 domain-containing protein [Calothrix sp. PCC 7507]AFY30738.1 hypothetical protein Cal7507_0239 [Calothrix sp. PCC 7507]
MWRQEKKDNSIVSLALLLALATIPTTATLLVPVPMLAQSATDAPAFPLPQSVENGTIVRIDGSDSLAAINQGLKQSFEKQFSGTKVEVSASGTDAALRAMLDGKVDLVALSRGLTPEEKAEGLEQVRLRREKIAIAVGAENPFKGNLTNKQFVKIFRGEITDWSQLGAPKGKIRIIDRPTTSDTRNNFRNYPAFKNANFATSSNATQVGEDNTAEIVKQLGKDGISYGLANHLSKLPDVRLISVNQISPINPKYPFSQPLVYVYKKNPSPAIASFLGFAIASPGQQAIDAARNTEAQAIAEGKSPVVAIAATPSPTAEATTPPTVAPSEQPVTTPVKNNSSAAISPAILLLLLLPLIGGLFIWWFLNRRSSTNEATDNEPEPTPSPSSGQDTNASLDAGTILTTSNSVDNITPTENPAVAGDVALGMGANTEITANPINNRHSQVASTPESDEAAWDIEAPAAVVNTSYPQLPDVPIVASDIAPSTAEVSPFVPEAIELPEVASDTDIWNIGTTQEQQPLVESNIAEDANYTEDAALAGAAIWSANSGTGLDIQENNETAQDSNISELNSPELPEIFPVEPELPEITTDAGFAVAELPTAEIFPVEPELPEITTDSGFAAAELPELSTDAALPTAEIFPVEPELPEITTDSGFAAAELPTAEIFPVEPELPEINTDAGFAVAELPTAEIFPVEPELPEITTDVGFTVAELPELPEVELNAVADAAEPTANLIEEDTIEIVSDLPETTTEATSNFPEALAGGAALAAGAGIGAWATIYGIQNASESNAQAEIAPVASNSATSATVVLTPQSSQSAKVSWHIPDIQKATLQNSGVSQLALRLYDVTGIDLSYQVPHLVQQYELESAAHDRFVDIPASDRDYITEIGYVAEGDRWESIARSATVRVFSPLPVDEQTADSPEEDIEATVVLTPQSSQSAKVSWHIPDIQKATLQNSGVSQLALRLYDVTGIDLSYQVPHLGPAV